MKTRYAELEDLPEVAAMYLTGLKEIGDLALKPNPEKCMDEVINSAAHAPCILLAKDREICGFAGLKTVIPSYTDQAILREYMFYIKPEHRSLKAAKILSDAAQAVSKKFNLPLRMGHIALGKNVHKRAKLLEAWGYKILTIGVSYGESHE